jgi:hypothetical protein
MLCLSFHSTTTHQDCLPGPLPREPQAVRAARLRRRVGRRAPQGSFQKSEERLELGPLDGF